MVADGRPETVPTLRGVTKPTVTIRYAVALAAVLLACVGGLAGCSSTAGAPAAAASPASSVAPTQAPTQASTQTPTRTPTQAPTQRPADVAITVKGRTVTPAPRTVTLRVGRSMTLSVTSDHDTVLHIHGFDIEKKLVAGTPLTVRLTGKTPGSYEVETHDPELRLLVVNVR